MNVQNIINLYNQGKSLNFIANKYNTYGTVIKKILIQNKIPIRTRAEQNRITNQERGKKVNHQYFDNIDTPQKAWLLGFLAADGSIHKKRNAIKIGLSSINREILEKIQTEIQCERNILDSETNQGFQISTLTWSSGNQKRQLAKYNIIPNKTYHEIHLPEMSKEYQLAYMLGYYDGDGCFKNDDIYCRIEICSYRPEILKDFSQLIKEFFNITKDVYYNKNRKNYYTLTYSTKDTEQILNFIYQYMINNNCFFLLRKFTKYNTWLKQNNKI